MTEKSPGRARAEKAGTLFSAEEKAAMKEAIRERRARARGSGDGEQDVRTKISEMPPSDRALAERVHGIVKSTVPSLTSRTWYGFPAYCKDDEIVCFFQPASKFKTRYATLGFSDEARLDDGHMWPVTYALGELTPADEAKIAALVKKAVGSS